MSVPINPIQDDIVSAPFFTEFIFKFLLPIRISTRGGDLITSALANPDPRLKMTFHENMCREVFIERVKRINPNELVLVYPIEEWGYYAVRLDFTYKKFVEFCNKMHQSLD